MAYRRTDARIQHSEEMRENILKAALILIKEKGLAGLTIRKTIDRASTSNGNFYFYFKDKEDLIDQLIKSEVEKVLAPVDRIGQYYQKKELSSAVILASMVYTGVKVGLDYSSHSGILFQKALRSRTYSILRPIMIERTQKVFESIQLPDGLDSLLGATMWQGSLLVTIEEYGNKECDHHKVALHCASWNLRALGWEQKDALQALEQVVKTPITELS
ncbi:TetR/AcrR family transcriptional regulator [Spirochaeta cellobiosiphila]|uniref:TetR/AcrR family transcriptional regulator n=1 Tax=Spirochaeta cellobiosiphila TaxID=504483 RepID=UPI00040B19FB|nr:TetR/AcrR family transcriptional regulator [Spirochaeta cellobiosiphila]